MESVFRCERSLWLERSLFSLEVIQKAIFAIISAEAPWLLRHAKINVTGEGCVLWKCMVGLNMFHATRFSGKLQCGMYILYGVQS
jgi:hypothetical protein